MQGGGSAAGFSQYAQAVLLSLLPPPPPPPPADKLGEELSRRATAAGATVLTYSLDSREADVHAEKAKVPALWLLHCAVDAVPSWCHWRAPPHAV